GVLVGTKDGWEKIEPNHNLCCLLTSPRCDPLFDPTGLRSWVRRMTNDGLKKAGVDLRLHFREKAAAAIDEEKAYAYFNSYTAYRFGFLAHVVISYEIFTRLFHKNSPLQFSSPGCTWQLLFEDVYLHFPDRPPG